MSKSRPVLKLHRLVGAVNFRPTLSYFHNIASIAAGLEQEFTEWNAQGDSHIVLNSPLQKKDIRITPDAITYYSEDEVAFQKSETDIIKEAAGYLTTLLEDAAKKFSVEEIRRVGFQITQIVESPFSITDLTDLIYRKFYSAEPDLRNISCDKLRDVAFVLDAVKHGFLTHVSIGPVNGTEAINRLPNLYPKSVESSLSANNLYIDVDVFLENDLTPENIIDKFTRAAGENIRILSAYKHYLDL